MTPKEVLALAKAKEVKVVDLIFSDIHGRWQHFSLPRYALTENSFEEGLACTPSAMGGQEKSGSSERLARPDPSTAFIDPFAQATTLCLLCDIEDPATGVPSAASPRSIARKAESYLKSSALADLACLAPKTEFFLFDDVRYGQSANEAFFCVDSEEAAWNTRREEFPNQGYKVPHRQGGLCTTPRDKAQDIRNEMVLTMMEIGIEIERHHHAGATAGQQAIALAPDSLLVTADKMMKFKHVVRNIAHKHGKTATFMPQPLAGDSGSAMPIHLTLWKKGKPSFDGDLYAGLSQDALYFIGGLLRHAPSLCALTNPTHNSYKRLFAAEGSRFVAAYSRHHPAALCRIPHHNDDPHQKRIACQSPDPSANPYLCGAALLMAGLDGIENKIPPGDAIEETLPATAPASLPDSLSAAVQALLADHAYLLKGDVFTKDFLDNYASMKLSEYRSVHFSPHPAEYSMYFDL